jgi:membrane-associated phospholipid phosphatase
MNSTHGRSLAGAAVSANAVVRAGRYRAHDPGYEPLVDGVPKVARPPPDLHVFAALCYDLVAVPFSLPDGTVAGAFVVAGLQARFLLRHHF